MYQNKVAIRKWSFCKKSVVFLIFAFCFSFFPQQSERYQSYSIPNFKPFLRFNLNQCLVADTVIIFSWCILYLRCFWEEQDKNSERKKWFIPI